MADECFFDTRCENRSMVGPIGHLRIAGGGQALIRYCVRSLTAGSINARSILGQSNEIVSHLHQSTEATAANDSSASLTSPAASKLLVRAELALQDLFDSTYGGFGSAPKFPHATDVRFLLHRYALGDSDDRERDDDFIHRPSPDSLLQM